MAAVFTGKVVDIRRNVLVDIDSRQVVFEVDRVWKGSTDGNRAVLHSYQSSVDYAFEEGRSYLVYATRGNLEGRGSTLHASNCGRTKALASAGQDLRELGPGRVLPSQPASGPNHDTGSIVLIAIGGTLMLLIALAVIVGRHHTGRAVH